MIYGVTVGSGTFAEMALCQLRSIHEFASPDRGSIVANCPPDEWAQIPSERRDEIRSLARVTNEAPPLPEYPLSAFHATGLACARAASEREWFVLLDTDAVVLDDLRDAVSPSATLALKPSDLHFEYGGLTEDTLRRCYNIAEVPFPETTVRTTVDDKPVPPYWNGGVVFASDATVVDRWIETTSTLHEHFPEEFFLEQLSLSVVSTQFETDVLTEACNFPLPHRLWVPSGTRVLHYHNPIELPWVVNPRIYRKLSRVGAYDTFGYGGFANQVKRLAIRLGRLRFRT